MYELFVRTLSQGLQAFMPVAVYLAYVRGVGRSDLSSSARWGIAAAVPLTFLAGYLFQTTTYQARWEATLAICAVAITVWIGRFVWSGTIDRSAKASRSIDPEGSSSTTWSARLQPNGFAIAVAVTLILVRQTMEIEVVAASAIALRSLDAVLAVSGGVACTLMLALVWTRIARLLPAAARRRATGAFAALFLVQALVYAFHESAEAHWLPWSEVLHAATEPYGPEGVYGRGISYLLFALPVATALTVMLWERAGRVWPAGRRPAFAASGILAVAAVVVMASESDGGRSSARDAAPASPAVSAAATIAAAPHLVFRHTAVDANYSVMSVAPLDRPSSSRAPAGLRCERVSFSAGRGVCLQADRGFFTTYKAVLFDRSFTATGSIKLEGSPSRTRVSPDGRVGAMTVFVSGHGYASSGFSTKTSLIDMASGDDLGHLEQFATWRKGARFKADDFNFWGVTFSRDSNIFYASLGTAGKTYLVKGDLGLRKFTVVHEDLECPSLSPDNRLIAFKRRMGSPAEPWRLYVLDLATMADRPVSSETRFIDDQVEWLDDKHILYGIQRPSSAVSDVWVAPIDGSAPARIYLTEASSPIVVR